VKVIPENRGLQKPKIGLCAPAVNANTVTVSYGNGQIPPDPTSWKPAQKKVFDQVSNKLETSLRQVADKSLTSWSQKPVFDKLDQSQHVEIDLAGFRQVSNFFALKSRF